MLQRRSMVGVSDNSGVVKARIMQIYSGAKTYAYLGNFVKVITKNIKRFVRTKKVKARRFRKVICRKRRRFSTIIRVKRQLHYRDGSAISFRTNDIIFYKKRRGFRGKRFFGITTRLLGRRKLLHKFKFYI